MSTGEKGEQYYEKGGINEYKIGAKTKRIK